MEINKNIINEITDALYKEIVGPSPNPNYINEETGEEILLARVHGSPKSRYGAGMLYPQQSEIREPDGTDAKNADSDERQTEQPKINQESRSNSGVEDNGSDEEPVGLANQYLPSAMGFTAHFNNNLENKTLNLDISSAFYEKGIDQIEKKTLDNDGNVKIQEFNGEVVLSEYWTRIPIKPDPLKIDLNSIFNKGSKAYEITIRKNSEGRDWLRLRVFNRTTSQDKQKGLMTCSFVLINAIKATTDNSLNQKHILFQNKLKITANDNKLIVPFQERHASSDTQEEKELNLLYRKKRIFAIGHGTSVSWKTELINNTESVNSIYTSVIPVYELPQVAPTTHVSLSMLELSDMGDWGKSIKSLNNLSDEYENWIKGKEILVEKSPELEYYREAAQKNVEKCNISLKRIRNGINFLTQQEVDSDVVKCFRWMNRAMIWQQQRSKTKLRKWVKKNTRGKQIVLDGIDNNETGIFPSLEDYHKLSQYNGRWRPFQLAFVLMNIESITNPDSDERDIVDLIWFPTGGGKTEAYLGLSAFNIFYRRIKGKKAWNWDFYGGTTILMRYTLRLLTTQQYERASSLICACDIIRQENKHDLGDEPISIGLWVGGSSSPNKNTIATTQLNLLKRDANAEYNFVVMKCPSCGAQIGKIDGVGRYDKEKTKGIHKGEGKNGEFYFQCENEQCEYYDKPLPLQVVDELIYKSPPTLLLGTVDKFAMVTWNKDSGNIFGFRENNDSWSRISPPELIIQDELHLIAGPLGTMVGLYETMVQTLCNNYNLNTPPFITYNNKAFIPPKIIASSATISRAYEQVKGLYGIDSRNKLSIFPAQGLEFGDTWFSEEKSVYDLDENNNQKFPGRKYVGVLASGYPSAQTSIVRSYSAVIQRIKEMSDNHPSSEMDYYWTLLGYFNSIRELGGASSLVYGDIRERLGQIQNRDFIPKQHKRYINRIEELTSRISSAEIPKTLKKLEVSFNKNKNTALDICLATNMVATGVDISRLGLMFIHGQPKTTAEYIQASSRVGRQVPSGPGLIISLYSPSKPRDKSQYEHFQAYHSRIYSNVEPTSVTPFSINARERGLHAVLIGLVRHLSDGSLKNDPRSNTDEFKNIINIISEILVSRCKIVDPEEVVNTLNLLRKRIVFWEKGFQDYGDAGNYGIKKNEDYYPLLYASSTEVREDIIREARSLPTPTSMRGVDTESELSIYSNNYNDGE